MCFPSWTSSHFPPHPIPLGHPSAPALSTLSHSCLMNLDWWSVSHMIICMFQCYSLRSSHPCLLLQSPKDCSIYLCLFCCLTYSVIITIFLNSIYMRQYTVLVFFFLAYFTLYNRLQFHPSHQNWCKWILFNGWVIFHGVYVPQLPYPFICWWGSRLLPCPGYYKQCCNEQWGASVSFRFGFLGVYAQKRYC